MCYIFRQIISPFHSELRKDKIATCSLLPPAVFLSPPTFWEARDQPEPGSSFPRMKDPGNEFDAIAAYKISAFLDGFLTQSLVTYPEIPNYRSVLNFACLVFAYPNFSESLISSLFRFAKIAKLKPRENYYE